MFYTRRASVALAAVAALSVAVPVAMRAQLSAPKFLKVSVAAPKAVQSGKAFTVTVSVAVDAPYHIQANPSKDGYIPTELEVGPLRGFKVSKVIYPKPVMAVTSGEKLPVYEGKVQIKADLLIDQDTKPGKYMLPVTLKFQGCDPQKCFPPTSVTSKAAVTVAAGAK